MTTQTTKLRTTGAWYLAEIIHGIDAIAAFRSGRCCYVCPQSDGRVFVIAAGGMTAIVPLQVAARSLRRLRYGDGSLIRVRDQDGQWTRWAAARHGRHAA